MLRALRRFLDTRRAGDRRQLRPRRLPRRDRRRELESGLARVFAGEYAVGSAADARARFAGERRVAVNDVVIASGTPGRIVELAYAIGGEDSARSRATG